jgi:hypothetical protein
LELRSSSLRHRCGRACNAFALIVIETIRSDRQQKVKVAEKKSFPGIENESFSKEAQAPLCFSHLLYARFLVERRNLIPATIWGFLVSLPKLTFHHISTVVAIVVATVVESNAACSVIVGVSR